MAISSHKPISSNVAELRYDDHLRTLSVRFHGGKVYTHGSVPPEVFSNAQKDWSAGKFYHSVIKRYPLLHISKGNVK